MTTTISAERLARVFVEVADTLIDEFDLIEFLQLLAGRTADLLDASPVGLLLADQRGRLEFMAASDENVKLLELFQVQTRKGRAWTRFAPGPRSSTPTWPKPPAAGLASPHVRWKPGSGRCTRSRCGCAPSG